MRPSTLSERELLGAALFTVIPSAVGIEHQDHWYEEMHAGDSFRLGSSNTMNILICDDEKESVDTCRMMLQSYANKHNVSIHIETVESGEKLLLFKDTKYPKIDLLYMDVHLPGISGFETASQLRHNGSVADIIFYTVDERDAIKEYDVDALHYIIKGKTSEQKFDEIFAKALKRADKRHVEILSFSCAGVHKNVPVEDIIYFSVQNRITTVHYYENKRPQEFEFYSSLSKITEFLETKGFVRIHGSYLVAKQYITGRTMQEVTMSDGASLPVGRTYSSNVKNIG